MGLKENYEKKKAELAAKRAAEQTAKTAERKPGQTAPLLEGNLSTTASTPGTVTTNAGQSETRVESRNECEVTTEQPKPVARKGPPPTPLPKLKLEVIEGGAGEEQADKEPETRDTRPKTQDSEPDAQDTEQAKPGKESTVSSFNFGDVDTEPSGKTEDGPSEGDFPDVNSLGTDSEAADELTAPDEGKGLDELPPPVLIENPAKVTGEGSEEPSEVPPVEPGPVGLDSGLGGGLFGEDEDTLSGESGSLLEGPDENNGAQEGSATQSGTIVNTERGGDTLRVNPSSNKPALLSYGEEVWTSVGGALVTGCAAIGAYAMNGYRPVAIAVAGAVTVLGLVAHAINNRVNDN